LCLDRRLQHAAHAGGLQGAEFHTTAPNCFEICAIPCGAHDPVGGVRAAEQQMTQLVDKCSAEHLSINVKLSEMWS